MQQRVFVMGCDGYIGNAITQRLLSEGYEVFGFDNFWRRKWIKNDMKSMSATPIMEMHEKEDEFIADYGRVFRFSEIDVDIDIEVLEIAFHRFTPDIVINLAHNPSGPYSMKSLRNANKVLHNNIIGTNTLLWMIKKYHPDCHYITIGTAGEYDHYSNIQIEEGYFEFEHKGRKSNKMIFPRRPGSIYHTSKTASTYLIDYLTRAWKLRCTDVMQGIVFGIYTPEIDLTEIWSRFDSDEAGGTVLNRFIIQAILGIPLTVYGDGFHQRSFLSLNDSVQALMIAVKNLPKAGEVQTWNQLSEWHTMNNCAEMVAECCPLSMDVKIRHIETPRVEHTGKHYYNFVTDNLKSKGYKPTRTIKQEIEYCLEKLLPMKKELEPLKRVVYPEINFR